MDFERHFEIADNYIVHVDKGFSELGDEFIRSRYLGFTIVSAVTVYEISIKEIIYDFTRRKHKVFGDFTESKFEKFNARIRIEDIKKDFVNKFGIRYEKRFKKNLDVLEHELLRTKRQSMKGSYSNLIKWRNDFVHSGNTPTTTNFEEVKSSYEIGKNVVRCLGKSLTR